MISKKKCAPFVIKKILHNKLVLYSVLFVYTAKVKHMY